MRHAVIAALAMMLAATPASAMRGDDKPAQPAPATSLPSSGAAPAPRQQAETWYADAYDEIAKADEALKGENPKSAEKRFRKALDRALRATEADTAYHEAWNLVGYAQRKLGRLDEALVSYERCLRLRPDYAAAREYLGEAHLEMGHLEKAKEQLAMLQKLGDEAAVATLGAAIAAFEKKAAAAPAGAGH